MTHMQLVKPFGLEADRHLLRCLFSSIDFSETNQTAKHSLQAKLLNLELNAVLNKSSLITNICFAIDNCFNHQKVSEKFEAIAEMQFDGQIKQMCNKLILCAIVQN